ncbi:MAG: extracellular solute-binding protein [Anaerolineae bacterium]|nr:extracellular solute-binding protein [Candidatus Roseilinea sp.]MDW8450534.1 extracellular solute-binding protein [Anaerolineae bacterium]
MRTEKYLRLSSLFALTVLLTACVGVPAAPPAQAPAQQPAEQPAAPATSEKIKLRIASIWDAQAMENVQPVLDEYMKLNPNIEIVVENTAGSGAAIYPDILKTNIASGNPPDAFFMWGGEIAGPFIEAGQVADLTAYYAKYGWDKKYSPWTLDRITRNGKKYGVPWTARGMGFWYNKENFAKWGVEVPNTFAEQEALCAKLKAQNVYCVSIGGKFGWHTMRVLDYFLEHHCGPEKHDQLNALQIPWTDPCVVESYRTFQKWIDNGWVVPDFLTVEPNESRFPFFKGEAALVLEGDWYEGVLKNNEQDNTKYGFYIPPTDHTPLRFSTFPEQFMITKDSKYPDETAAFLDWFTSVETAKKYPKVFASSATLGTNPDCSEWPLTCAMREKILAAQSTYPPTDQAFRKELMDGFFEVQDSIVAKKITPEEGAKLMQQRVEEWKAKNKKS